MSKTITRRGRKMTILPDFTDLSMVRIYLGRQAVRVIPKSQVKWVMLSFLVFGVSR